jgi:bifunctional non-homologous end joining protein LigD
MADRGSLDAYRRKRDPERTPEPFGGRTAQGPSLFVVQKHRARQLHYDLRLEMDGVLKSWAVPKGPSVHAEERRLAVHVEDHPVEYAEFEGVIPPDNYGAGAVILWDRGHYTTFKHGEDLLTQLGRGKLELELHGYKLRGRWTLVRMSKSEKDWLLLKKVDGGVSDDELIDRYPRSVKSGLTIEEIGNVPGKIEQVTAHLASVGAVRREVAARGQAFMLATLAKEPPNGKSWLFEVKYDGVRVLAERRGDHVALFGRNGTPVTDRYPEIVGALRALPYESFVIDGEIVALDAEGRPDFHRLQRRMLLTKPGDVEAARRAVPVAGAFFDCLGLLGYDLRRVPLLDRKAALALLLPPVGPVHYGDHILEHGDAFFDAATEQRLEGIVAKKITSVYVGGRAGDWIKVKCQRRQEFVIGGYTDPQRSRAYFGALHLGVYENGALTYVSRVGSGFDAEGLKAMHELLRPLRRDTSPFAAGTPTGRGHHWVEPTLVCEVQFAEWTPDGGLRHPVFMGLRRDKPPHECRREPETASTAPAVDDVEVAERVAAAAAEPTAAMAADSKLGIEVRVTNPNKVFWPDEGYTKADLVDYYVAMAPWLLPYLRDRPVVLTRYPDGIAGKSFFQKDAPDFVPAWVRTERIYSKDAEREINYFVVNDVDTLKYVANSASIPLHLWSSRLASQDRPDWLVLDLDPKGAPFADVVEVARALHEILETIELPNYVKTSGSTGLHILVPLGAAYGYEEARTFARLLAMLAQEAAPDLVTLSRPVRSRGGKVYVDYVQNGHGRTIAAPYSLRPLPGAPASCPLEWREVTPQLDPSRFTLKTMRKRFEKMADPMAAVLRGAIDMAEAVGRIEERLRRSGDGASGALVTGRGSRKGGQRR